jgi:hypothetical protein
MNHVASVLERAAADNGDTVEVAITLRLALILEGFQCRPAHRLHIAGNVPKSDRACPYAERPLDETT